MIRIALVDDHAMFRKGLIALLNESDDYQVTIKAANGQELLDALEQPPGEMGKLVDLVLLDLDMPVMDGQATLTELQKRFPDLPVIILSMHQDEGLILHLMQLGAKGYLLKESEPEEVEAAIDSVIKNGFYLNDRVSRIMLLGLSQKDVLKARSLDMSIRLTEREMEVLAEVCKGLTNQQIADRLFLSARTVEGHRKNIMEKMGVRNTAGMIVYAIQNGLVNPEDIELG